jgi:hypothetical protein
VTPTTAEIAPVRRQFVMQKQLKATFVSIHDLKYYYMKNKSCNKIYKKVPEHQVDELLEF